MTTLMDRPLRYSICVDNNGQERREHRRHDMDHRNITIDRWDGGRRLGKPLGQVVDLSATGVRIRADGDVAIRPDSQVRVRLSLPPYAGICPFIDRTGEQSRPKMEWVGWMTVTRVVRCGESTEIGGRLVDMDDIDRGMLGLYLSTQPLAA